ncbi:MAG: SGNH/GDSL hydrolase family protein [Ruminococcaceae bacterium]|nr:SGNH/GDSL hydrolase family protein [Oscillospiraceae bacterium]
MKKVVLYGDSIRIGYEEYIRCSMEGIAEVYFPSDNCRYAQYLFRLAHVWKEKNNWPDDIDVVHWNAGLWDVLELFGDGPLSSIEHYRDMIVRIDRRLRLIYPNAKMIFATSTAVVEEEYGPEKCRHNSVIEQYNAVAIDALKGTDTVINDLYAITRDCPRALHSDKTHYYTEGGVALVGGQVLSAISRALEVECKGIDTKGFCTPHYSKDTIGF